MVANVVGAATAQGRLGRAIVALVCFLVGSLLGAPRAWADGGVAPRCGDSTCNGTETCFTCPFDCGACGLDAGPRPDVPPPDATLVDPPPMDIGRPDAGDVFIPPDLAPPPDTVPPPDVFIPPDTRPTPFCGDGVCGGGETCSTCAMDCGPCLSCGDGMCTAPETCGSCPFDCRCADAGTDVPRVDATPDVRPPDVPTVDATPDVRPPDASPPDARPPDAPPLDAPRDGPALDAPRDGPGFDAPTPMDAPGPDVAPPDAMRDAAPPDAPRDAGDGGCNQLPSRTTASNFMVSLRAATPSALGTRGEVFAESGGMLSSGARDNMGMPECYMGASLGGQIRVCVAVGGQETCQSAGLTASVTCNVPAVCTMPPQWSCDESRHCCTGMLTGNVGLSRTWTWGPRIGTWVYNFSLGVGVTSSVSGSRTSGPGCACRTGETSAQVTVTGSGMGGGTVGVRLFGYEYTVAANAGVCLQVGGQLRVGCGVSASPVTGAAVSIAIPAVRLGFFTFEWSHRWEVGSGC